MTRPDGVPGVVPKPSSNAFVGGSSSWLGPSPDGSDQPAAVVPQPGLVVVFDSRQLGILSLAPGVGGKIACQWQRELRRQCIEEGVSSKDVTNDPLYDWKQLLRSADTGFALRIIGQGIVRVVFRIIETERDK